MGAGVNRTPSRREFPTSPSARPHSLPTYVPGPGQTTALRRDHSADTCRRLGVMKIAPRTSTPRLDESIDTGVPTALDVLVGGSKAGKLTPSRSLAASSSSRGDHVSDAVSISGVIAFSGSIVHSSRLNGFLARPVCAALMDLSCGDSRVRNQPSCYITVNAGMVAPSDHAERMSRLDMRDFVRR